MSDTSKEARTDAPAQAQDKRKGPNKRSEPPKKVQMIEPVLRRAPMHRDPSQSTAAFLRTAKAEAHLPDYRHARLESSTVARPAGASGSGSQANKNRHDSTQQELYMQQVQDALREGSPDMRGGEPFRPQQAHKRPTSKLAPRRQQSVSPAQQAQQDLSERMHQHVLGGRLWYKECQDANQDLPEQLPLNYDSSRHYVSTFEPLLFEEAREAVRSTWVETCDMKKTFMVDITSLDETASGSVHVHLKPSMAGNRSPMLRENSLVVLTLSKPPAKGSLEWVQGVRRRGARRPLRTGSPDGPDYKRPRRDLDQQEGTPAGLGPRPYSPSEPDSDLTRRASPDTDQRRLPSGPGLSADQQRQIVAEAEAAVGRKHSLVPVVAGVVKSASWDLSGDIFVTLFPACSAHAHEAGSCCQQVVQSLRDKPKAWHVGYAGALISQEREYKALHEVKNMQVAKYILKPQVLADIGREMEAHQTMRHLWPPEARTKEFVHFIRDQYDPTQQAAIEIAACHLGKNGQAGVEDPSMAILPFVLIQGPPGTGKTHTVRGILNVWHIVHYNRFLESLVKALARESCKESVSSGLSRTLPNLARKPRILVCAPSNAATDELLQRIMDHGFRDFQGKTYRPNVVRIGSEEAPVSQRAKDVWVDLLIARYMDMDSATWEHRYTQRQDQVTQLTYQVAAAQKALQRAQEEREQLEKALPRAADKGRLQEQVSRSMRESNVYSYQLAHLHEERDKALVDMSRLEEVAPLARQEHGVNRRMVRENLELSFVQEAEMVFTTLSSTGRKIFSHLENAFENVLVDEAAQASEIAVLQPLMLGCKRVVLVGDPQQLPATVLSRQAQLANMERSMFERFQRAGCPVTMLSVQYRMHPSIRQFPSQHFYNNQLQDGASVIEEANSKDVMYEHDIMKPYVFFDVSTGRESRQGSGSLRNQGEADLAAALFFKLRSMLADAHAARREGVKVTRVGVITPYRQQRKCLQDTFQALCADNAKEVVIETVDSFQGKQMDVVIMSCVRASEPGLQTGIGFVSDIRRMNVAITRAKRALWILGSAATLKASPVWQALIDDAEWRGTVVRDASAEKLFPDMTELLLMQANRRPPTPEPHSTALDRLPQQAPLGDPQITAAGVEGNTEGPQWGMGRPHRGRGSLLGRGPVHGDRGRAAGGRGGREGADVGGRMGPQASQGGRHGGQGEGHVGQGSSHGLAQSLQQVVHQETGPEMVQTDVQNSLLARTVQTDPRQAQLTPAQRAIQQGKLQQQLERQQQQQHQQRLQSSHPQQQHVPQVSHLQQQPPHTSQPEHQQPHLTHSNSQQQQQIQAMPFQLQPSTHEQSFQQQQLERQQHEQHSGMGVSQHQASMSASQAQQPSMHGVQHGQWDSKDASQTAARSRGINSSSPSHSDQHPSWLHSQYPADARPRHDHMGADLMDAEPGAPHLGHQGTMANQYPARHHDGGMAAASTVTGNGMAPQARSQPHHVGEVHASQAATPEMPMIPTRTALGTRGRQHHDGQNQPHGLHAIQYTAAQAAEPAQGGFGHAPVDLVALPRQTGYPLSQTVGGPKDPRRVHRVPSKESRPVVAQSAHTAHLGRHGLQHSAETPQVPEWTNNRR